MVFQKSKLGVHFSGHTISRVSATWKIMLMEQVHKDALVHANVCYLICAIVAQTDGGRAHAFQRKPM